MHVKTKMIAVGGVCLALAMVLIFVGSTIEVGSFAPICLAAFTIGIVTLGGGLGIGGAYLAASILLGVLIIPNKLHIITFGLLEGYLFLRECIYDMIIKKRNMGSKAYLLMKLAAYVLMVTIPAAIFPALVYEGEMTLALRIGIPVAALIFFVVLDTAYDRFMQYLCNTRIIKDLKD
ncbi:MAG: hypothetical protein IK152_02715 [Lachnospiraceae bacterium]|nr:hypothetical protein [Lachnospiraceae bacterium]